MLIGYVRVSKSDGTQTLAPQRDAMLSAGVDPTRIYEDLASGRRDDRPGLAACLKAIQPGNTLVLWKLDRLGRDLRHLVNTVRQKWDLIARRAVHHCASLHVGRQQHIDFRNVAGLRAKSADIAPINWTTYRT